MAEQPVLVRNAADPKQVKAGARAEKRAREIELDDLRVLLASPAGRRFLWRVLGYCKFASDIWDGSSRIHFNAGVQNVGHWMLAEITAADEEAFFLMMRENSDRLKREAATAEAVRTDRADQQGDNDGE
jgi:hypothetical protein